MATPKKSTESPMQRESKKFSRNALRITPAEERCLRMPLKSVLLDIRLPVAMRLAFEAGWKAAKKERKNAKS